MAGERSEVPLPDSVDRIAAAWATQAPELPVGPMEIITRLGRLRARFDEELAAVFARYDLSAADFAVIAALRRAGEPYELRQSVLMDELGLTSGTVSVRIDRLQRKEIVTRRQSAEDARSSVVALTEKGLRLFEEVGPAHLRNEDTLLSALTGDERNQLAGLLRKLLVSFEHERSVSPLGMTVAPAHVARRMRTSVGLSDTPGLLVTAVARSSAADAAGLQEGDLLVAVDGDPLLSCVDLAAHGRATRGEPLAFTVLRGADRVEVGVPNPPPSAQA